MTIAIVDYGVGNLGSIKNMLSRIGADAEISADPELLARAPKLILPGVGAFDAGMRQLVGSGLKGVLDDAALVRKVPIAGICLGMQLMTKESEEGRLPGLGWVPASTVRFMPGPGEALKVPHMGWNSVSVVKQSPVLEYLDDASRFYFVHSFYVRCEAESSVLLQTNHGLTSFNAAFQCQNLYGFQFHPEKSHRFGMALLRGFVEKV